MAELLSDIRLPKSVVTFLNGCNVLCTLQSLLRSHHGVYLNAYHSVQQIGKAKQQDSTLSIVSKHLHVDRSSAHISSDWKRFPLCCYKQLWSQLTL